MTPSVSECEVRDEGTVRKSGAARYGRNARGKASAKPTAKPKIKFDNISEQRVLKNGVMTLHGKVSLASMTSLLELPRRSDGSSRLLRQSFFERLLNDETQVQRSLPSDITAAQSDIKHLTLEQMLVLRSRTLDFATESRSHDAHNNFLETLDRQLFEQIAKQFVQNAPLNSPSQGVLFRLGKQMTEIVGCTTMLREYEESDCTKEESAEPTTTSKTPKIPSLWAIPLNPGDWAGSTIALFNVDDLVAKVVSGTQQDIVEVASTNSVAVVCDRTSGSGTARRIHWEISSVTPATEDLSAEIARCQRCSLRRNTVASNGSDGALEHELARALLRRNTAPALVPVSMDSIDNPCEHQEPAVFHIGSPTQSMGSMLSGGSSPEQKTVDALPSPKKIRWPPLQHPEDQDAEASEQLESNSKHATIEKPSTPLRASCAATPMEESENSVTSSFQDMDSKMNAGSRADKSNEISKLATPDSKAHQLVPTEAQKSGYHDSDSKVNTDGCSHEISKPATPDPRASVELATTPEKKTQTLETSNCQDVESNVATDSCNTEVEEVHKPASTDATSLVGKITETLQTSNCLDVESNVATDSCNTEVEEVQTPANTHATPGVELVAISEEGMQDVVSNVTASICNKELEHVQKPATTHATSEAEVAVMSDKGLQALESGSGGDISPRMPPLPSAVARSTYAARRRTTIAELHAEMQSWVSHQAPRQTWYGGYVRDYELSPAVSASSDANEMPNLPVSGSLRRASSSLLQRRSTLSLPPPDADYFKLA